MLLVITLYCIWWLLKEPFCIHVTEVTFNCCRGVCRGSPLRYEVVVNTIDVFSRLQLSMRPMTEREESIY